MKRIGQGAWQYPNSYHFNLPRSCNHCSNPPCVAACLNDAVYRRDEDGLPSDEGKIPVEYLEKLFGPGVREALKTLTSEREKRRRGENSALMDLLIAPTENDLFAIQDRQR